MLTFRKGGYDEGDLLALYNALTDACSSFHCAENGCDCCPNRKPCADITRCREHVRSVLNCTQNQTR